MSLTSEVRRRTLEDGWTVEGHGPRVPVAVRREGRIRAEVPGCVHTDLLAAQLIDDPYVDDQERLQAWIGQSDWTYRTTFAGDVAAGDRSELVFDGLDTVARIELNGHELGRTRNMHRTHRFDVTGRLSEGANELVVHFSSPVAAADAASLALGARPHVNDHPYNALRKMACSFGWDWGPATATSGIWRPVRIESWRVARLASTRVTATVVDGTPQVEVEALVDVAAEGPLTLTVSVGDVSVDAAVPAGGGPVRAELRVPGASLWWPIGFGNPDLHDVGITLSSPAGLVDRVERRVGFRTAEVRHVPDEVGQAFQLVVNGEVVMVRGVNWIPDDAFPHRVDAARYAERIDQALVANVNLVRVWGGGIYESEAFYEACDVRGVLTWQDFLFACAAYAEEEPLRGEIEAEAREAASRLGVHPSLVVLNGNNENAWGYQDWGWQSRLDGKTWGRFYYEKLFPSIVSELAPQVAYTPASPFSPDPSGPQNDPAVGTVHVWDVWNQRDYAHYRDHAPRFVAEFGWQGPPTWPTLTAAVSDDPLTPESPGMIVHQKAESGNDKLTSGLVPHFRVPDDFADWHWAMSLNQALAVRLGVGWFRSLAPRCTGTILWQLNDCWPVTSWSAVDGAGRPKPTLFALRQAYEPRLLTVQPYGGVLTLVAINDTAQDWDGELVLERRAFSGRLLAESRSAIAIPARQVARRDLTPTLAEPDEPGAEVVVARLGQAEARWYFAKHRDQELRAPGLQVDATRAEDGWRVAVRATAYVRDLSLLVDRLDPETAVDQALVDLFPGETTSFTVRGALDARPEDFVRREVLRSGNDLVADATGGSAVRLDLDARGGDSV